MTPRPRKVIYPIFLPHAGCPYQCVYCNQHAVVSTPACPPDLVGEAVSRLVLYADQVRQSGTTGKKGEIAFYGGTFTALPREILTSILESTTKFVEEGLFTGIRFSTRPDCLEDDVCGLLSKYPVSTVELGAQSLCDHVLKAGGRGYSAGAVFEASARVRQHGWALGLQLMAGLPEDSRERFMDSVRLAIGIGPDFMRIYPTVVLNGTPLAALFRNGSYRPLTLEQAIEWVVPACEMLQTAAIPIIRMGLHADPILEKPGVVLAGPYHPAFGSLVRGRWWRERVNREISALINSAGTCVAGRMISSDGEDFVKAYSEEFFHRFMQFGASRTGEGTPPARLLVRVAPRQLGDVIGPARCNIEFWKSAWNVAEIRVLGDEDVAGAGLLVEIV